MENNANETLNSCSNLGFTYKLVHEYDVGSVEAQTFLTGGEFRFQLSEIEVYVNSIKMNRPVVNEDPWCLASHGPSFGAGDICIRNNSNKTFCSSYLGSSYKQHSQHVYGSVGARSFLAGLTKFKLSEIEVNQKE